MRERNYEAEEERAVQVDSAGVYFCSVEEFGRGGIRIKREKLDANVAPAAEAVWRFTSLGYVRRRAESAGLFIEQTLFTEDYSRSLKRSNSVCR
jgi:hypothetical protein